MKRLPEDKEEISSKKPKIVKEWAFFNQLTYYEQKRWLFALQGLSGNIDIDAIREILILFMHVSCLQEDEEGDPVAPLTRRYYYKYDGKALFKDIRQMLYTQIRDKVEEEHKKLVAKNVKKKYHGIIIANDNPRDGLGKIVKYTDIWFTKEVEPVYEEWIDLPRSSLYTCVDIMDTATIRKYLYDYSCLSIRDLSTLQNSVRRHGGLLF